VRPASLWYMCVSHRSRSSKPHVQTSQNFKCTLRMAVDRSSSDERRQCNIWPICTGWRRKKWNIHNSCLHIFGNTYPDLITFLCMLWPWVGHSLPALCTLCTSGLVDDVIFSNNGLYGASDASTVGRLYTQSDLPGGNTGPGRSLMSTMSLFFSHISFGNLQEFCGCAQCT